MPDSCPLCHHAIQRDRLNPSRLLHFGTARVECGPQIACELSGLLNYPETVCAPHGEHRPPLERL